MLSCSMIQSSQAKELSEEDRQKKEELELLVQRAQDWPRRSQPADAQCAGRQSLCEISWLRVANRIQGSIEFKSQCRSQKCSRMYSRLRRRSAAESH